MDSKPLVSFIIVTYNQENYIGDALDGALSQTYSPMEIIVSDDCSSDNTMGVVEDVVSRYSGQHQLRINRNEVNLGIAQNVNKAMQMANGEIFIVAAGDDKSFPERTQRTVDLFSQYPQVVCINFNSILCNRDLKPMAQKQVAVKEREALSIINMYDYCEFTDFVLWSGDARSIRRSVYDVFGPLVYGKDEDSAYFVRSLLLGGVCHSQEPMSWRRIHGMNVSDFRNIKKYIAADFIGQPNNDIQIALQKGLITDSMAKRMQYKIRQADRLLADRYYSSTNKWYRMIYQRPTDLLRRIKNKLFA